MIHPFNSYDEVYLTSAKHFNLDTRIYPIRTNVIINKGLTGWGATYAEIKCNRHSIILLPHKNQIASKHAEHTEEDYTQEVAEGVTIEKLKTYIRARGIRYMKFLSTPEALGKVVTALKECGIDVFNDVFLLCDESHKITTDVGYRVNISGFADYFFQFKNKAMISATPFKPSHPKFTEQGFEMIKVNHVRNIKKKIKLICVNNLGVAFKDYLDQYDGEMLFVFFNSLNGIKALIDNNQLAQDCNIYCSEDGVKDFKLKEKLDLTLKQKLNAYSRIDSNNLAKINFLTSSFFNGLDIDGFEQMPDVLLLTDLSVADHTTLDPNTDVYQILGRFRQPKDSKEIKDRFRTATHIVNNKRNAVVKLEDNALSAVGYSYMGYKALSDLQQTVTNQVAIDIYEEAKKRLLPYANLINTRQELDHFKVDNYLYEWRLKQCYGHPISLPLAYEFSELFNVIEEQKVYLPEDFVAMSKTMSRYSTANIKWCCAEIIQNQFVSDEQQRANISNDLKSRFPLIIRAEEILGMAKIQELRYKKTAIERALMAYDIENGLNHHGLIDAITKLFKVGTSYQTADIKVKIQKVYDDFNIDKTAKATDIETYFRIDPFTGHVVLKKKELKQLKEVPLTETEVFVDTKGIKKKSVRMYKILERKLNPMSLNSTREKPFIPSCD
jgi:hypothetical protein